MQLNWVIPNEPSYKARTIRSKVTISNHIHDYTVFKPELIAHQLRFVKHLNYPLQSDIEKDLTNFYYLKQLRLQLLTYINQVLIGYQLMFM